MQIKEFAKMSTIPKRILFYLNREGFIGDPLSAEEQICLSFLEKIWGKKEVLRAQIVRLSMQTRISLIKTADLPTKWERYAFSRFHNMAAAKKLPMPMIIEEIQTTFGFVMKKEQVKRLYKLRNRAHAARHREKKRSAKREMYSLI